MKNLIFFFALLTPFFAMSQTTCESCPDSIDKQLIVNGSIPPAGWSVTYAWDNGITSTTNTADVIVAGVYTATITWTDDSGSCTDVVGTHEFTVTELPPTVIDCRYRILDPNEPFVLDCDIVICEDDGRRIQIGGVPTAVMDECSVISPSGIAYTPSSTGLLILDDSQEEEGIWTYNCIDDNGCPFSMEITMTIIEKPVITLTGECIDN